MTGYQDDRFASSQVDKFTSSQQVDRLRGGLVERLTESPNKYVVALDSVNLPRQQLWPLNK